MLIDRLHNEAGPEVAGRFVESARSCLDGIAASPSLGSPVISRNSRLAGLRKRRVLSFPNILIFYLPEDSAIAILRVMHAAQDWKALLDAD